MRICAAFVESAFAWRRATGERETCWCKRGVSLVSGMIGGIVGYRIASSSVWTDVWRNYVRDVDLRGLGGKCVCVAPCHWGARNMLV